MYVREEGLRSHMTRRQAVIESVCQALLLQKAMGLRFLGHGSMTRGLLQKFYGTDNCTVHYGEPLSHWMSNKPLQFS